MWSDFTNNAFKRIKKKKYNNSFINKIKCIRSDIKKIKDVEYKINIIKINNNIINNLKSSEWVSKKLSYDYLLYEINITWNNNNNNIYIKTTEEKFNNFKHRIPIFLKIINYINKDNDKINIYLILSNLKKYVNVDEIISPDHVNSGYCDVVNKYIFIWREEEFEKVCFHEIIHLINHDHRHEEIDLNTNIDGDESYYEAITDFKAIIYNLIYLSLITKIKLSLLFSYEYFFIKNQSYYIYNVLKVSNKQNTPAYSYFILKKNIFKYFNYEFNELLFNDIFFKNINYYVLINIIKDYINKDKQFIDFNSARMTLFELK